MSSVRYAGTGTDTDTETQAVIKLLLKKIEALTDRVEFVERVNHLMEEDYRKLRREAMHTENVLCSVWRRVMGPLPTTPDPVPTTPDPIPTPAPPPIIDPAPAPAPPPRPKPPVPRPPATPAPDPIPTPPAPPKPPTGPVNRVSEAFNSLRGRLGW